MAFAQLTGVPAISEYQTFDIISNEFEHFAKMRCHLLFMYHVRTCQHRVRLHSAISTFLPTTLLFALLLALIVRLVYAIVEVLHVALGATSVPFDSSNFVASPVSAIADGGVDIRGNVLYAVDGVVVVLLGITADIARNLPTYQLWLSWKGGESATHICCSLSILGEILAGTIVVLADVLARVVEALVYVLICAVIVLTEVLIATRVIALYAVNATLVALFDSQYSLVHQA